MNYWAWIEQIRRLIDSYLTNNYYYITCLNETCKSQFKRGFYSILGFKFKRVFSLLRSQIKNSSFENFQNQYAKHGNIANFGKFSNFL